MYGKRQQRMNTMIWKRIKKKRFNLGQEQIQLLKNLYYGKRIQRQILKMLELMLFIAGLTSLKLYVAHYSFLLKSDTNNFDIDSCTHSITNHCYHNHNNSINIKRIIYFTKLFILFKT